MPDEIGTYYENTKSPWGKLFYRVVWDQLPAVEGGAILDFGSGFGITANHLAENNCVVAVEPNEKMLSYRARENGYRQILGGMEALAELDSSSFDLVLCHNVLEYAPEREEIVRELSRLLKPGGTLSVVKHHHPGRVLQKAVNENALEEAAGLLQDGEITVRNFGKVDYYDAAELPAWAPAMEMESISGVRTFWALQQNYDVQQDPEWQDRMFALERLVYQRDPYRQIAFFHHVLLRKRLETK